LPTLANSHNKVFMISGNALTVDTGLVNREFLPAVGLDATYLPGCPLIPAMAEINPSGNARKKPFPLI
jgi:hypothetical protein